MPLSESYLQYLQSFLGYNLLLLVLLVLSLVLLRSLNHPLNLILTESSPVASGECDIYLLFSGLHSRDIEDTVGINFKEDTEIMSFRKFKRA